jgi:hypothetical protein
MLPLKWSFDGFIWQIFRNQDFDISGCVSDGTNSCVINVIDLLDTVFNLRNIPSWGKPPHFIFITQFLSDINVFCSINVLFVGLFGAVIGYALLFRFNHYFLFAYQTGRISLPFAGAAPEAAVSSAVSSKPVSNDRDIAVCHLNFFSFHYYMYLLLILCVLPTYLFSTDY